MKKLSYTVLEAVSATGLSRSYLFRLMEQDLLAYKKPGRDRLIMADDLEALMDSIPDAEVSRGEA